MRERIREGFDYLQRLKDSIDVERKVVRVSTEQLSEDPGILWDAFVSLVTTLRYEDLRPEQRPAYLAFWYQAEVENGGHYQYFLNSAGSRAEETVEALVAVGAGEFSDVLKEAIRVWHSAERKLPETPEEFVQGALDDQLMKLDRRYGEVRPTLFEVLSEHVEGHKGDFVDLVAGI